MPCTCVSYAPSINSEWLTQVESTSTCPTKPHATKLRSSSQGSWIWRDSFAKFRSGDKSDIFIADNFMETPVHLTWSKDCKDSQASWDLAVGKRVEYNMQEVREKDLLWNKAVASQLHWHAWDVKQGTWLWACGARDWLLESKRSQYQTWVAKAMQQALCTRKNHQRKNYSNDLTPKNIREMFRQSEHCEKHQTIWAIHPLCKKMISIRETRKQKSTMKSNTNGFSVCTLKKIHRQRHFNYWFQNFAKNLYGENYFLHTSKKKVAWHGAGVMDFQACVPHQWWSPFAATSTKRGWYRTTKRILGETWHEIHYTS